MTDLSKVVKVIIVRKDLNMRKGKIAAQAGHSVEISVMDQWRRGVPFDSISEEQRQYYGEKITKVCVSVNSEQELMDVHNKAKAAGLDVVLVEDEGLTEFHNVKTKTCICIGPHTKEKIHPFTGHLPLY